MTHCQPKHGSQIIEPVPGHRSNIQKTRYTGRPRTTIRQYVNTHRNTRYTQDEVASQVSIPEPHTTYRDALGIAIADLSSQTETSKSYELPYWRSESCCLKTL